MADPPRAATIRASAAVIGAKPGPIRAEYNIALDTGFLYEWMPGNPLLLTLDGVVALGHVGGTIGAWRKVRGDIKGADLADGAETVKVGGKQLRVLPIDLTANRVWTLDKENAQVGDMLRLVSRNTANFTVTIDNDGQTPSTLKVAPGAAAFWSEVYFNVTGNWELTGFGAL